MGGFATAFPIVRVSKERRLEDTPLLLLKKERNHEVVR